MEFSYDALNYLRKRTNQYSWKVERERKKVEHEIQYDPNKPSKADEREFVIRYEMFKKMMESYWKHSQKDMDLDAFIVSLIQNGIEEEKRLIEEGNKTLGFDESPKMGGR